MEKDGGRIKPSYYAVIEAEVRYSKTLSSTAKLIYAEITALTQKEGFAWASNKYFADNFSLSPSQVSRIIAQLAEEGFINVYIKDKYLRKITLRKNAEPLRKNRKGVTQKAQGGVTQKAQDNTTSINTKKNSNKEDVKTSVEIRRIYDLYIKSFEKEENQYKLTPSRQAKIRARLKDAGAEMLTEAIKRTSESDFHRGSNDRGWRADLDFIIRSYEQTEKLAGMEVKNSEEDLFKKEQEEFLRRKNANNQSNLR